MSNRTETDVRWVLTREKYFSLRPKPLERWLWRQGIPQAAERVFWVHWEEGMRRGDWCSELAIRQVARDCAVDTSTVTRAYQVLKRLGLMRREDPGRDPANPFRQSIAVTEVLLPRELVQDLSRFPNRGKSALASAPVTVERIPAPAVGKEPAQTLTVGRAESKALMEKLSAAERHEFFLASRDRRTAMVFDADTQLLPEQRGRVLELAREHLQQQAGAGDASQWQGSRDAHRSVCKTTSSFTAGGRAGTRRGTQNRVVGQRG